MKSPLISIRRFISRDRASMRRPFLEAQASKGKVLYEYSAHVRRDDDAHEAVASIGDTAKYMAYKDIHSDDKWTKLVQDAFASVDSLTPSDIALLVNSLTRTQRAHPHLYNVLAKKACSMMSFFSSSHLAMIMSAYAKANLMEDMLYEKLKEEINRRMYEFTTPIELCMVLNALARCKEADEVFLRKLASHINHHVSEFIPQEISLLASRFHDLNIYDSQLFYSMEERIRKHIGRYDPKDAMDILAAYDHFDKNNKELRQIIMSNLREEHVYLSGPTFVKMVEESRLSPECKSELLALEYTSQEPPKA